MKLFPESLSAFLIQVSVFLTLFLLLLFSLNGLLFRPVIRIIEKRKKATEGTSEELFSIQAKTDELNREWESKITEAKTKAAFARDKIKKEGEEIAQKLLSETKDKTSQSLKEVQLRLSSEEKEARIKLKNEVDVIAQQMSKTILEKSLS